MTDNAVQPVLTDQVILRAKLVRVVERQLPRVTGQLAGTTKKPWTAHQVKLFLGILDKVLPNISASYSRSDNTSTKRFEVDPASMSRDELEAALARELGDDPNAHTAAADARPYKPTASEEKSPTNGRFLPGNSYAFKPGNTVGAETRLTRLNIRPATDDIIDIEQEPSS